MNIKNCWSHFKLICIHKWWVYYYSRYFGIRWQGFWHDMSKFSPTEFFESVKFYTGVSSPINEAKRIQGISYAWQHHKGRNPHHYEYWTDCYDTGTVARKMPFKYVLELVCDYLAACRAYNKCSSDELMKKELEWWNKTKDEKCMHPETKRLVSAIFDLLDRRGFAFGPFGTRDKIDFDIMREPEFRNY